MLTWNYDSAGGSLSASHFVCVRVSLTKMFAYASLAVCLVPSRSFVLFTNAVLCKSVYFSVILRCMMYASLRPSLIGLLIRSRAWLTFWPTCFHVSVLQLLTLFNVNTLRDNFLLRFSSVILSSSLAFELRHLYQHGDAFLPAYVAVRLSATTV